MYLWAAGLGVFAVIGIVLMANAGSQSQSVEGAHLQVSETAWDIGNVAMSEGVNTKTVEITNDRAVAVTVIRMETSCMCTTAQLIHADGSESGIKGMVGHGITPSLSETIQPGETVKLLVRFDPNAHGPDATGPIQRSISIETNSKTQSKIQLKFSGNVIK